MPGSSSSSVADAVLTSTSGAGPPLAATGGAPGTWAGACFGTSTCRPSVNGAARLSDSSDALAVEPPAASIASTIRSPSVNSYTPGFRTAPATSTMSGEGDGDEGAVETNGFAVARRTSTGFGSERLYQSAAPQSVTTMITTRPMSSL